MTANIFRSPQVPSARLPSRDSSLKLDDHRWRGMGSCIAVAKKNTKSNHEIIPRLRCFVLHYYYLYVNLCFQQFRLNDKNFRFMFMKVAIKSIIILLNPKMFHFALCGHQTLAGQRQWVLHETASSSWTIWRPKFTRDKSLFTWLIKRFIPEPDGGLHTYLPHERQQHPRLDLSAGQLLCGPLQLLLRIPRML